MRSLLASLALLFIVAASPQAIAVTAYYQPTPFPKYDKYGNPGNPHRHVLNGWLPSYYYGQVFQKTEADDKLQVGGWGDIYRTYLQFDVEGLPDNVTDATLLLYAIPRGDSSTLVNYDVYIPTSAWATTQTKSVSWDTTMTWSTQPSVVYAASIGYGSNNSFWGLNITSLYNAWVNGSYPNTGLMFTPWSNSNNFDVWCSSRNASDGQRPLIALTFTQPAGMPNFKLPLPSGSTWLLTNEAGGFESLGETPNPDQSHQDGTVIGGVTHNNYFALDFSPTHKFNAGGSSSVAPPVLAAANGTVIDRGNSGDDRGNFITIDHGNGYQTRYLHLAALPARKNGTLLVNTNTVLQGDQIGVMGNTGSVGLPTHLHINFWVSGSGIKTSNMRYATMEGLLLKSYQTESDVDVSTHNPVGRKRYYPSTNTPTGN